MTLEHSWLLLHRNATLPWFILVPHTREQRLHRLSRDFRTGVMNEADAAARFLEDWFACDHVNQASIGNQVPQLHVHVIGRYRGDPCWPGVVWGRLETVATYQPDTITRIQDAFLRHRSS